MEHLKTYRQYIVQAITTLSECDNQIFTEGEDEEIEWK